MPEDSEEAFAATVAPTSEASALPTSTSAKPNRSGSTQVGHGNAQVGNDATVAAPLTPVMPTTAAELPPLPDVDHALYRTDKEIARGGMGRILAAEDRRLARPVALKELLDPAPGHVTRFQREALITARLQHPGIVPVYEAGRWQTGEPFFAMKLVKGRPLDAVIADAHTIAERLALLPRLASACDAMAYAHSQRIIHRDLKPGNVLLGEFGETVVIDWGLAKDLDVVESLESTERAAPARASHPTVTTTSSTLTVAGAVMGTPAYMPPEQARGEPVDQHADVFALGAMLYHLLCGAPPYSARSADEAIAAAAQGKFVPLSHREANVPAELETIVGRAMARDAGDRYPHAGELAEELRRFLTGQLVGAHRYTAWQRVRRFVRMHRAAVTISAIAVIGFAVGGSIAVHNIVRARDDARHESRIAVGRRDAAETLIKYMLGEVQGKLTEIGRLDVLAGLSGEMRNYFNKLEQIPGGMTRKDEEYMVQAMEVIGRAEHTSGQPDQALKTWSEARDKIQRRVGADARPPSPELRFALARVDSNIANIDLERGHNEEAERELAAAGREWAALIDEKPTQEIVLASADNHDHLGDLLRVEGKLDKALEEYTAAKQDRERATTGGNTQVSKELRALSTSHVKLGQIYQNRGESSVALDEYRAALQLRVRLAEEEPNNVQFSEDEAGIEGMLADLERVVGDDRAARGHLEHALPITEMLVHRDAVNTDWQRERANTLADLGLVLIEGGYFKDAIARLDQSVTLLEALVARDAKRTGFAVALARSLARGGDARLAQGASEEAIALYERATELRKQLVQREPTSVPFRRTLAGSYAKLSRARELAGDVPHALEAADQALALRQLLLKDAAVEGGLKSELAASEIAVGRLTMARDPIAASASITSGAQRARELANNDPSNFEWKQTVIDGLLAQAAVAAVTKDRDGRASALADALVLANDAAHLATDNATWPGYVAQVQVERAADAAHAGDAAGAAAARKAARDVLAPLAKDGRLSAQAVRLYDTVK